MRTVCEPGSRAPRTVRTGSWMGPPQGKRAPRVGPPQEKRAPRVGPPQGERAPRVGSISTDWKQCHGSHGFHRLIDSCITQLKAQEPSRTCNESKEEDEEAFIRTVSRSPCRLRAKRGHLERVQQRSPGSQSHNLTLTVLYMPCSLDSGSPDGSGAPDQSTARTYQAIFSTGRNQNGHLVFPSERAVDVRLPRGGNSNSHGARPVHLIITMIKWIRTSRLTTKNSRSDQHVFPSERACRTCRLRSVLGFRF